MKVTTPEDLLGLPKPKILWHHGTCDMCSTRLILVCHLGYDTQPDRGYRVCKNCMAQNIQLIIYGKEEYTDGLISLAMRKDAQVDRANGNSNST